MFFKTEHIRMPYSFVYTFENKNIRPDRKPVVNNCNVCSNKKELFTK